MGSGRRVVFGQLPVISKSTRGSSTSKTRPFPLALPLQVTMSMELVVAASSSTVTTDVTDPSTSQYDDIFGRALNDFEKLMGQNYKPTNFESAKAVLELLDIWVPHFDEFMDGNQRLKLKTWLELYVDLLFTVSAMLW